VAYPPRILPTTVQVQAARPWGLALRIMLVGVGLLVALWFVANLYVVLLQILTAIVLATGLSPLVKWLLKRGIPRAPAVLLIYLCFIGVLVLLGVLVLPPAYRETNALVQDLPEYGAQALESISDLQRQVPGLPPLDENLAAQIGSLSGQVGELLGQVVVVLQFALGIVSGLLNAFLILLMTFYLIVDGTRIRDYFLHFAPPMQRPRLRNVTDRIGQRMGGWLLGQLALSAAIGIITFVVLTILGVKYAVLLAVIAAIGEAIPMVGPLIAMIPAVAVAATQSPLLAVGTLVAYLVIQQVENNFLVPKIMERAVNLHPLAVIVALVIGSEMLGVSGAILSVPVAAAIAVILEELQCEVESADAASAVPPAA
jgi:predicted PurR-regulated permease PerM